MFSHLCHEFWHLASLASQSGITVVKYCVASVANLHLAREIHLTILGGMEFKFTAQFSNFINILNTSISFSPKLSCATVAHLSPWNRSKIILSVLLIHCSREVCHTFSRTYSSPWTLDPSKHA